MTKEFQELHDKLSNDNYHTDALIVRSLNVMRYDLVASFAKIAEKQEELGFLSSELNIERTELMKSLWKEEEN